MSIRRNYIFMMLVGAVSLPAWGANTDSFRNEMPLADETVSSGPWMPIPLVSWPVDPKSFIAQHPKTGKGAALKAATDPATVYRPVKVCRLIDTRGFPAGINIPGPLAGGSTTLVNSAGVCGIPSGVGVAGISVSFHVFNMTVNNGGYISFLQQGAPISGTNAVFNVGAQWTAATANVSIPDDSGNFEIFIAQSTVQVIVDVNGYYQDLDFLDVGTQQLDVNGTVDAGSLFEVTNNGTGSALTGTNQGSGPGLMIGLGSFAVAGAGVNTQTAALVLQVGAAGTACTGLATTAVINNPMLNASTDMVFVTPRAGAVPVVAVFNACPNAPNRWAVQASAPLAINSQYNVFFIKTQ